ncbi:hypothetical protein DPMN_024459 [Dreissena polymorpha]|uniref:Uncharacterized protein n=1 Tax=Dreissena polymorpha TaxID=45954 RepID=A0A9D4RCB9_DREPO|nr:hypothetical protein DPMN_024459 [Dreissena polymorpha]
MIGHHHVVGHESRDFIQLSWFPSNFCAEVVACVNIGIPRSNVNIWKTRSIFSTVPIPRDFLRSVWGVKCQQKHDKVITYLALVSGQGLREEKIEETVSRDRNAIQKGTLGVRLTKSKGMFFPE